jgi:hypothetical protein
MSRDTILTDEANVRYSYDHIRTQSYLEGHSPGLDAAAGFLRTKATALFEAGKHDEAIAMQKLAKEMVEKLEPEMEKRAKQHKKDYPEVIESE